MQALILAGGEGTRLRPLTTTIAKPVVPLVNRPFITYMLDWLGRHGFDDIVMSCGFLADGVRQVLGTGDYEGLRIRYVDELEPLGTAGAVKLAEPLLEERFAVLNGDILTDLDLSALRDFHERRGASATLTLIAVEDPSSYGLVLTEDDGRVAAFIEKPKDKPPTNLVNAGIYMLERSVLDHVAPGRSVSFEREVFPALVDKGLYGLPLQGYWLDIGTPERYLQATRDILSGAVKTAVTESLGPGSVYVGPGSSVDPEAHLNGPALVGSSCSLEAGTELGPGTALGDGCRVARGATVREAALHDGVIVEEGAFVTNSIVGAGARLGAGCRLEEETIVGEGATVGPRATLRAGRVEPARA